MCIRDRMNIWENLQIYKHKTQNKLIPEQIHIVEKMRTMELRDKCGSASHTIEQSTQS